MALPSIAALAILGLGLLLGFVLALRMKQFLARTRVLQGPKDMWEFKRIAAWNMYGALAALVLAVAAAALLGFSCVSGGIGARDLIIVMGLGGLIYLPAGLWIKSVERKVQSIPTADDSLREERDRVVQTWLYRALPDW